TSRAKHAGRRPRYRGRSTAEAQLIEDSRHPREARKEQEPAENKGQQRAPESRVQECADQSSGGARDAEIQEDRSVYVSSNEPESNDGGHEMRDRDRRHGELGFHLKGQ